MSMILVGRNLSPFVRRVAVVLKTLGLEYEQKEVSAMDDSNVVVGFNPLTRVPALQLDDGEVLIDSNAIIDHLLVEYDGDHSLLPAGGADRRAVLRLNAIAVGAMEKGVAGFYEKTRRPQETFHGPWFDKLTGQCRDGLAALDDAAKDRQWLFGSHMTIADISAVILFQMASKMLPHLMDGDAFPNLRAIADRCADQPAFAGTAPVIPG